MPISLFACITETSAVSSVMRLAQPIGDRRCPVWSTGSSVVRQPRRASAFSVLSTASCSIALAIRCRRPVGSSASAAPRIAKLSDSVPPLVNTISDGSALMQRGDRRSRVVERRFRLLAEVVNARRVAELIAGRRARRPRSRPGASGVVAL